MVTAGALLLALLLLVVALMIWQEAKRRSLAGPLVYSVDDAVDHTLGVLAPDTRRRLGRAGVRRIIEWETYYLQGLADGKRAKDVTVVAGGYQPAVEFIAERIAGQHGVDYTSEDIREVLAGEAEYLMSIGAVGDRVEVDE